MEGTYAVVKFRIYGKFDFGIDDLKQNIIKRALFSLLLDCAGGVRKRRNQEASRSSAAMAISDGGSGGRSNGAKCERNCELRSSANCGV